MSIIFDFLYSLLAQSRTVDLSTYFYPVRESQFFYSLLFIGARISGYLKKQPACPACRVGYENIVLWLDMKYSNGVPLYSSLSSGKGKFNSNSSTSLSKV